MAELKATSHSQFTSAKVFDTATYIGFLVFVLTLPFGYSTAPLNIGLSLVLFGWIGRMISEKKLGWQRTPLDLPIVLFLGLALIASLFAPHPSTSSLGYFWKITPCNPALLCGYPQSFGNPMATYRHRLYRRGRVYLRHSVSGITLTIPA